MSTLAEAEARAPARSRVAAFSDRALYAALLLAVLAMPYEAGYPPMSRFLGATFTNLEIVLLALGAALVFRLAADSAARSRFLKMPLLAPIAVLLLASILSYLFGEYRDQGINATYRLLMGAVIFIAAWESLTNGRRLLAAMSVLVASAAVSATLGLLEYSPFLNIEPYLAAFKPMPTTVGGAVRLSGTFEYANGAAFYFEMALPIALALATLFSSAELLNGIDGRRISERVRRAAQVIFFALCAVFMLALLLTFSRAGLGGMVVSLAVFGLAAAVAMRSRGRVVSPVLLRGLAIALGVMAIGAVYIFLTQPVFRLRLTTENDREWYSAAYTPAAVPTSLGSSETITVPVTLRNDGPMIWRSSGSLVVHLSYHWRTEDRQRYVVFEGLRTQLPGDIGPGETVTVDAQVQAPSRQGVYYLEWDLAQEHYTWFSVKAGANDALHRVQVVQAAARPGSPTPGPLPQPFRVDTVLNSDTATISRTQLWKTALSMFLAHPLTGVGPDGFRNLYGPYAGVKDWNKNIYTNNTYIELFTNLGLLGGLAFVWLGALALYRAGRSLLGAGQGAVWLLGLGATASTAAFFFHGFLDYFLFSTPLYSIFWLLLAVAACWSLMTGQQAPSSAATDPGGA